MRRWPRRLERTAALLLCAAPAADSQQVPPRPGDVHRHQVEAFPIMAFFDVYSIQYAYRITERRAFIVGAAYVNVEVSDRTNEVIGRMHSPTLPLGVRRYVWRDAHVEYQLWPAYKWVPRPRRRPVLQRLRPVQRV